MISQNRIYLNTRNNFKCWLEQNKEGEDEYWTFNSDNNDLYLEYIRILYDFDHSIGAVDPSGGPFISVDDIVCGKKVEEIKWDKIIKLYLK